MGRYKRKQDYYKQKKSSSLDNGSGSKKKRDDGKAFSPPDLDRVKEYLIKYRDGCFRIGVNGGTPNSANDETAEIIGGVAFPILTPKVLSQPYLALPSALTPKRRRSIHIMCIQLDLFHESLGPTRETRTIVVSIYSDGFGSLQLEGSPVTTNGTNNAPPSSAASTSHIPIKKCRPWFCRQSDTGSNITSNGGTSTMKMSPNGSPSVEKATKEGRRLIETLMDQPSDCLRDDDGVDVFDFAEMDGQDLSTVETPSASDRDGDHWMMIDSTEKMKQCAQELTDANITELAFDLEFYNPSKYLQVTCLLQLSSNAGKDYVIDTLAEGVWDNVALLRPLFVNPAIVKIGHSISGDVKCLHRDFGIFVVNVFDTYEAVQVLQVPHKGLASVCRRYGLRNSEEYAELKSLYQATDWRRRPLTEPMIRYGRYDVHYLVVLRRLLIRDLVKDNLWNKNEAKQETKRVAQALADTLSTIAAAEGDIDEDDFFMNREEDDDDLPESNLSDDDDDDDDDDGFYTPDGDETTPRTKVGAKALRMQPDLMRVLSSSQERCLDIWRYQPESLAKNTQYADLMKMAQAGEVEWTHSHAALMEDLIAWRSHVAIREECLEGLVFNMDFLISIATKRPANEAALKRIRYKLPELLQQPDLLHEVLAIVQASLAKDGMHSLSEAIPSFQDTMSRDGKNFHSSEWSWCWLAAVTAATVIGLGMIHHRRRR